MKLQAKVAHTLCEHDKMWMKILEPKNNSNTLPVIKLCLVSFLKLFFKKYSKLYQRKHVATVQTILQI